MPTSVAASTMAPHSHQARLHRGFPHFELMRTAARCCVLQRAPHEREDADGDRYVPNRGREVVEQGVDVSVHPASHEKGELRTLELASTTASERGDRPTTRPVS